jgi:hypothetical protein
MNFFRNSKVDIKTISSEKPVLNFNMHGYSESAKKTGYFNPNNKVEDKIAELEPDFYIPHSYIIQKDTHYINNFQDAKDAYKDIAEYIYETLEFAEWNPHITLCKGMSMTEETMYRSDMIVTIVKNKKIIGFAFLEIKKDFKIPNHKETWQKALEILMLCSDKSNTEDGKSRIKGVGSLLIESIKKIGNTFDCDGVYVNSPSDTTKFFEKMGFDKTKPDKYAFMKPEFTGMILPLKINITHTVTAGGKSKRKSHKKKNKRTRKSRN